MVYVVTFYALRPGLGEFAVAVQRIRNTALKVYTRAPGVALGAARRVNQNMRVDGFRIVDAEGRVLLDYVDRRGQV